MSSTHQHTEALTQQCANGNTPEPETQMTSKHITSAALGHYHSSISQAACYDPQINRR